MRFRGWSALTLVTLTALLACGGSSDDEPAATAAATRTPAPTIEVTANDYYFSGLPDTVPFGTTLSLVNNSESEFHELAIAYFGVDETGFEELVQLDVWDLIYVGRLTSVLFSMPGEPSYGRATGSGWANPVLNKPGRWVIWCAVPIGANPDEVREQVKTDPPSEIEGRPRHYAAGMIAEVIVEDP